MALPVPWHSRALEKCWPFDDGFSMVNVGDVELSYWLVSLVIMVGDCLFHAGFWLAIGCFICWLLIKNQP